MSEGEMVKERVRERARERERKGKEGIGRLLMMLLGHWAW
jgi:hypothetical protein